MRTVNFKQFRMFKDITQSETEEVDLRRDFSDLMYKNTNGVVSHDLALKIYRSEGDIELSDDEYRALIEFAAQGTPLFIDSINANIKES